MKKLIIALVVATAGLHLSTGVAYAGCGKKVATVGTLKAYNASQKLITIQVALGSDAKQVNKSVSLSVTPSTQTMGNKSLADLVGTSLSVVSEHGKVDWIIPVQGTVKG